MIETIKDTTVLGHRTGKFKTTDWVKKTYALSNFFYLA